MILIFLMYLVFAIPASIGMGVVFLLTYNRVKFDKLEYLFITAPWVVWFAFFLIAGTGKSESNAIGEPIYLACLVVIIFLIRSILEILIPKFKKAWQFGGAILGCISGIIVWALVPGLFV